MKNGYAPALSIDKLSIKEPSGRMILTGIVSTIAEPFVADRLAPRGKATPRDHDA